MVFVLEINSTGDEILSLRIVPVAYLIWPSRYGMGAEIWARRWRFVNDLAIADGVDIVRANRSKRPATLYRGFFETIYEDEERYDCVPVMVE